MRLSSSEKVDRILVTVDVLNRLSSQILDHTESVRERVNTARWELRLRARQQAEEQLEFIASSLPSAKCSPQSQIPCGDSCVDTIVTTSACICGQGDYGLMIMCNNSKCQHQWFHIECAGLQEVPEGDWLCPLCAD